MDYKEQIKHPNWQKKRLEILERDNFTCQECGVENKTLHVHHFNYIQNKKIWEYNNEMLITLCENCHKEKHLYQKMLIDIIKVKFTFTPSIVLLTKLVTSIMDNDILKLYDIINYINHE